nr:translational initiation factor 1 [Aleurites moluccanus]QVL29671.1 translation initiation factor 1 [Aleurites moluccanus]WFF45969.1 translational initiation factor 1 [Aleurites moluccanus]
MKEQKWIRESLSAESLFQYYFQVHLANEDLLCFRKDPA